MRHVLVSIMVAALAASPAMAQTQMEKGDREVQAAGYLFTVSGITMVNLSGIYGYFYSNKLQIGGGPTLTIVDTDYGNDTNLGLTLFCRYYFTARDKLVPYAGGQWYQFDVAPDDPVGFFDMSFVQGGAGVKYFVNEYVAWDVSGNLGFSLGGGDVSFIAVAGISAIF